MTKEIQSLFQTQISNADFEKLSTYINSKYGIKLPPEKKVMLQSRLHKRLRSLNLATFDQYLDLIFSKQGNADEEIQMMNVVSTNKTDFFRESTHFDFLTDMILPAVVENQKSMETLNIWSAGCSSGEEAYTTAIVVEEYFRKSKRFNYQILGTDISTKVLSEAIDGVYQDAKISNISMDLKKRYFLKSKTPGSNLVRLVPELRKHVQFRRLNFMDNSFDIKTRFDVVFCRNVLIYFEREVQQSVINKLCACIKPGGYLFIGHSESITNMKVPLTQVRPTIFRRN